MTKQFAIMDSTGAVLRLDSSSDTAAGVVLAPGETAVEMATPVDSWPEAPTPGAVLMIDDTTGVTSWDDPRTLAEAKADRRALMRAARDAAEDAGFTWDGSAFYSDARSESRIQGAVILAMLAAAVPTTFSIVWTLADDTSRTLDGDDMIAVGQALGAHVDAVFAHERTKLAAIDAATTIAEVDAIDW